MPGCSQCQIDTKTTTKESAMSSIRHALHLPRRRSTRPGSALSRALSRATTPSAREELLYLTLR